MQPSQQRPPALQQLYSQKHQYQQHKQKLQSIYQERKSQLNCPNYQQYQHVKNIRSKSFVHKVNENNLSIARQNLKIMGRLVAVRASVSRSDKWQRPSQSFSHITPVLKNKMMDTEKQNYRISKKMRNMSSSLNQKHFLKDYQKSQRIKTRLMKYETEDSRVFLKSERYLMENEENSHSKDKQFKSKGDVTHRSQSIQNQEKEKKVSYYRREDIMRNKIDTTTSSLAGIRAQAKARPNTSLELEKIPEGDSNFFTTQPRKIQRGIRKTYM